MLKVRKDRYKEPSPTGDYLSNFTAAYSKRIPVFTRLFLLPHEPISEKNTRFVTDFRSIPFLVESKFDQIIIYLHDHCFSIFKMILNFRFSTRFKIDRLIIEILRFVAIRL